MAKSLRVLPSFHTCRELNLIAFRVIFSCYTQNQNILMRTIVLTNLLIKLLFSFNSLLLKKNSKGTAMDFAIISKESTAYDLQPLVCLRMLLSWKLYFKPLYLITGAHSPNCHPALYYQQSNNSMMLTTPTAPIWSRGKKAQQVWCVATVWRNETEQWRVACEEKKKSHYEIFVSRMFKAFFKPILCAI